MTPDQTRTAPASSGPPSPNTASLPGGQQADPRRWLALAFLSLAQLMDVLDGTIINIALPNAQQDLGFGVDSREYLVTGYALAYGSLLLFGGRLADRFGRRKLFLIGLVGFGLCSAVGGAAVNFGMLLTARIAQGVFAAALAPAALSLVSVLFAHDRAERGKAFGVFGAVSGMGGAVGLVLGGYLVDALSWRWCLYINVAIAGVALLGAVAFVRDQAPGAGGAGGAGSAAAGAARSPRGLFAALDVPGAATVAAGLFGVVFGLGNSAVHGWSAATTWLPLTVGVLLLIAFVVREDRVPDPLLPLTVVLDRNRGAAYLAIGTAGVGSFAIFLYLSYYLQQTLHYSALKTGLAFLPFAGVLIAGAGIAGSALLPRTGPRPLIPAGCLSCAASLLLLLRISEHSHYLSGVLPSVLLFGFGVGVIVAPAQNVSTSGVQEANTGVAAALVNTMQQVGGSLGLGVFTAISAAATDSYLRGHRGVPRDQLQSLAALSSDRTVFSVAAGIFIAGAAVTFALFRPGIVPVGEATP